MQLQNYFQNLVTGLEMALAGKLYVSLVTP
jgi:hypothetical protein